MKYTSEITITLLIQRVMELFHDTNNYRRLFTKFAEQKIEEATHVS